MADSPAPPEPHKSSFGFLGRKIGPVPVWVIAVGLIAAYYWYAHYGPGKNASATAAATPTAVDANGNPVTPTMTESSSSSGGPNTSTQIFTTYSQDDPNNPKPRRPVTHPPVRKPPVRKPPRRKVTGHRNEDPEARKTETVEERRERETGPDNSPVKQRHNHVARKHGHTAPKKPVAKKPGGTPEDNDIASTKTVNITQGRWQNQESVSIPVTAQVDASQSQTGSYVDVIPHRPLGM